MVYITAFILTLFLTHIARALPRGCSDAISPESDDALRLSYGDSDAQYAITNPVPAAQYKVTYDPKFDNELGSMDRVACSDGRHGLAARFAQFRNVPTFPYIGGAHDIHWNSPNCGSCWKLTNTANNASITITTIDRAGHGFNIAETAFEELNGGEVGEGMLQVEAHKVPIQVCGL
jgi:Cerato-platanin